MNKLFEILKKYAEKRKGGEIQESFEQLKKSFKASVELLIEEGDFATIQKALNESFAKELFDKYTDIVRDENSQDMQFSIKMKEAKKEISEFHYIKQWWKNQHLESASIDKFFLITKNNKFCFSKDLLEDDFKESFLYNTVLSETIPVKEGVIYLSPKSLNNNSEMPAWIKVLAKGTVAITESTELRKIFEFSNSGITGRFIASREDENSDFWTIQKEAKHRHDTCMQCSKTPTHEVLWAEGHGHAWFCESDLKIWIKEHKDDIISIKEIKDGIAADKFAGNTNPNIKDKISL